MTGRRELGLGAGIELLAIWISQAAPNHPQIAWAVGIVGAALIIWGVTSMVRECWPSKYVTAEDAGRWLYARALPSTRQAMRDPVFGTIEAAGKAFVIEAATAGAFGLYGRHEEHLPIEPIEAADGSFTAFEDLFGSDRKLPIQVYVRRRDLRKLRRFYTRDA